MSDTLKIKLSVADRIYPLTIKPSQEEGLRKAAKQIESMIKQYEQNYAVRDKQDVLAMCVLQLASQIEQKALDSKNDQTIAVKKLTYMNDQLCDYLSESS